MTEKKFKLGDYSNGICEIWITGEDEYFDVSLDDAEKVCNMLNEFYEENEKLKQEVTDLKEALIRCAFDR